MERVLDRREENCKYAICENIKYPNTQIPKYPENPKYPNTQAPKYPSPQRNPKPEIGWDILGYLGISVSGYLTRPSKFKSVRSHNPSFSNI